jgi:4-hydroxy-tetrahydrodipicolinate synthase
MRDDYSIDVPGLKQDIDWWISEGTHGLIPTGSTGEFSSLDEDEQMLVIETTVRHTANRVPVLAGTGAERTEKAVRLSRFAESVGADALMVVAPYYSLPTEDELFVHYRTIADAVSLPIMIYNNPWTTGVDMKPAFLARLADVDNIRYCKESTFDVRRVRDILRLTRGTMEVFAGYLAYESYPIGATGWVSVTANIAPKLSARLFDATVDQSDYIEGRRLYERLTPLVAYLENVGKYVQIPKQALDWMGLAGGPSRRPRLSLTATEQQELRTILVGLGVLERTSTPAAAAA